MKTYRTFSSMETKVLAAVIAEKILVGAANRKRPRRTAIVIALRGDLGAGKTTFTQGFLKALGARGRVTSPTFVLMKRFSLATDAARKAGLKHAYHIDAYRFRAPKESGTLGLKDIFQDPSAVVLVEWPERLKGILPKKRSSIHFKHGKKEDERVIIAP